MIFSRSYLIPFDDYFSLVTLEMFKHYWKISLPMIFELKWISNWNRIHNFDLCNNRWTDRPSAKTMISKLSGTQWNKTKPSFSRSMLLHWTCWMDFRPAASSFISRDPRWAQQVLFSPKAVRNEFDEPSSTSSSFHVGITGLLTSWASPTRRLDDLPWFVDPRLQTTNNFFSHGNRPFQNACQLLVCLCWEPFHVSRLVRPETGQFLWLNSKTDGQEAPTRKILQPMTRWNNVSEVQHHHTYPKVYSQENWINWTLVRLFSQSWTWTDIEMMMIWNWMIVTKL